MKTNQIWLGFATVLLLAPSGFAQITVATDNADFSNYSPPPNGSWPAINGGSGYNNWTPLSDASGGGAYMEGVGVNGRQVEGNYSFALYAGSGAYDISRPLSTSLASGDFSILTRFDLAGSGPNLISLRSGNNTASFGAGELLSFGIVNGNELSYTDASGFHLLSSGEARGDVWDWNVDFDAALGTYSLSVTNLGGGYAGLASGNLEENSTTIGSFAVINSSSGGSQNLIFDVPTFTVPEPSTLALGAAGLTAWLRFRRRG